MSTSPAAPTPKESFFEHVAAWFKKEEAKVSAWLKSLWGSAAAQQIVTGGEHIAQTALGSIAMGVAQELGAVEVGSEGWSTAISKITAAASAAGVQAEHSAVQLALSSAVALTKNAAALVSEAAAPTK